MSNYYTETKEAAQLVEKQWLALSKTDLNNEDKVKKITKNVFKAYGRSEKFVRQTLTTLDLYDGKE